MKELKYWNDLITNNYSGGLWYTETDNPASEGRSLVRAITLESNENGEKSNGVLNIATTSDNLICFQDGCEQVNTACLTKEQSIEALEEAIEWIKSLNTIES